LSADAAPRQPAGGEHRLRERDVAGGDVDRHRGSARELLDRSQPFRCALDLPGGRHRLLLIGMVGVPAALLRVSELALSGRGRPGRGGRLVLRDPRLMVEL
jgi:hypothetical protein